jgi:tetratricopeptide (TPR) repeat protein
LEESNNMRSIILEGRWLSNDESNKLAEYHAHYTDTQQQLGDYVRNYVQFVSDPQLSNYLSNFKWGNAEFNSEANNAKLLFSQEKYDDQLASANKMLTLAQNDDERSIAYYWQGLAYYSLEKGAQARTSLMQSISLDETNVGPYSTIAALDLVDGKYQDALDYATKCAELDPTYGWCYNNKGLAYAYLGQKDKAVTELEKAVATDPSSYVFNDNLKRVKAL